jgi:hypothetical protein
MAIFHRLFNLFTRSKVMRDAGRMLAPRAGRRRWILMTALRCE